MTLFLLLSTPVFFLFASFYLALRQKNLSIDYFTFFKGMLWFFPTMLFLSLFRDIVQPGSFRPVFQYLTCFYRDHFLYLIAAVGGYLAFFGIHGRSGKKADVFYHILAFFCGLFTIVSIQDFFMLFGQFNPHNLFLVPIARIASIIAIALLLEQFFDEVSGMKIVYGVLMLLVPLAASFVSLTYMQNLGLVTALVASALLAGSSTLYYMWKVR